MPKLAMDYHFRMYSCGEYNFCEYIYVFNLFEFGAKLL